MEPQHSSKMMIFEKTKRLSQSTLWQLQKEAYCQLGPKAWISSGVPSYITSNPYIAKQYAQLVLGYLRDCIDHASELKIDWSEPFYIFDLGAGSGRFSYLFLKELKRMLEYIPTLPARIQLIMTDIAEQNINFWKTHPWLKPLIEEGLVDFAHYSHEQQKDSIELVVSQKKLISSNVINPLVLVGNYFFDTIPQDLFQIEKGVLFEGKITLLAPERFVKDNQRPSFDVINHIQCDYSFEKILNTDNYYEDPVLNRILKEYLYGFEKTTLLFPIGAFQCLNFFKNLSKDRLLLLVGDQGVCTLDQMAQWKPLISLHGTFSFPVCYHALASAFTKENGIGLLTTFPNPQFVVFVGILSQGLKKFSETHLAFLQNIDQFEPQEYWKIVGCFEQETPKPSLEYLFLILKMGNWDPSNWHFLYNRIRQQLPLASETMKAMLSLAIDKTWEQFYPISAEEGDFIANLAVLFYEIKNYEKAVEYFKKSLEITGEKTQTFRNLAICYQALGQYHKALEYFNKMP